MTFKECIEKTIKENYKGTDNTCRGKCSKCGECCGIVLPVEQEELDNIQDYVIKHKIYPQRQQMIMAQKLQCPYYTGNKDKGCVIYEVRPKVCRIYKCDRKPSIDDAISLKKCVPVDMWAFAQAVEKEMKRNGIN